MEIGTGEARSRRAPEGARRIAPACRTLLVRFIVETAAGGWIGRVRRDIGGGQPLVNWAFPPRYGRNLPLCRHCNGGRLRDCPAPPPAAPTIQGPLMTLPTSPSAHSMPA